MHKTTFEQWAYDQHKYVNQLYDKYLPYEFHLRMVKNVGTMPEFKQVYNYVLENDQVTAEEIDCGLVGHDLIEDCHQVNYNDIVRFLTKTKPPLISSTKVANMIFGCTNSTGKNADERHDDAFFERVRTNPGSRYVKVCDRIANVQYGIMMRSHQTKGYKKKNDRFKEQLLIPEYTVMFDYLDDLFKKVK